MCLPPERRLQVSSPMVGSGLNAMVLTDTHPALSTLIPPSPRWVVSRFLSCTASASWALPARLFMSSKLSIS